MSTLNKALLSRILTVAHMTPDSPHRNQAKSRRPRIHAHREVVGKVSNIFLGRLWLEMK